MKNVVGRVGSIISQGVLAIAVPFHPFGGAIDVIVVQQQDGTFRSTPWHIQFGKFQGVLKGAEKVRITVNGVEANFLMCLDSSGEAYFIRDVDSSEGSDGVVVTNDLVVDDGTNFDGKSNGNQHDLHSCMQEHGTFDTSMQMQDGPTPIYSERNEMEGSDGEGRFYFQDEQSPLDDSVEMSDCGSNQYANIEIVRSQDQKSEIMLGSVDGHVPTEPISGTASEKAMEKVQWTPPQHRPDLGDRMDFVEGNEKFDSGGNRWPCNCNHLLNASKNDVEFYNICSVNNDTDDFEYQLEVCEGEDEHVFFHYEESQKKGNQVDITSGRSHKNRLSKGCLLPSGWDSLSTCSSSVLPVTSIAAEKLTSSGNTDQSDQSVYFNSENIPLKNDQVDEAVDHVDGGSQRSVPEDECSENELSKFCAENSNERMDSHQTSKFEISLCGSKLHSGMGLSAAAEAFDAHLISAGEFESRATSIIRDENLIIRFGARYWHWDKVAPIVLGIAAFGLELPMDPKDAIPMEQSDSTRPENEEVENVSTPCESKWSLWHIPFRRVKKFELNGNSTSKEEVFLDSESELQSPTLTPQHHNDSPHKRVIRTNIPTTEQIASLNLREGQNRIDFTFPTKVFGVQKVDAHIYLWKWNARIVISDVDGTITKSDVLGQFMPLVGMDWTQSGVARLFSAIKENGYQLLFLSARAIVQAYLTRSFLLNLKQDGEALPNGPVVISPDGLFPSLYREVIRRTPHEFKISCLEEIRSLFPPDHNPFYAGFGNRETDELSYVKMGIPKGKIFIINPKGEVVNSHCNNVKSYNSLLAFVDQIFPPTSLVQEEEFNRWNYWKMPLPEVD